MNENLRYFLKHNLSRWYVILLIVLMISLLSGCFEKGTVQRTNQIPSDGGISHKVFKNIKATKDIGIFNGNSNGITYQWMFLGSGIDKPKDENLLVTFSNAKTTEIKKQLGTEYVQEFSFSSNGVVSGKPSLSIYLNTPWNANSAEVYQYDEADGTAKLVSEATLENSPNGTITFIPKKYKGLFYIVGVSKKNSVEATNNQTATNNEAASTAESSQENQASSAKQDDYLSKEKKPAEKAKENGSKSSTSNSNQQDKYLTNPIPEGKPKPTEPENTTVNKGKKYTATLSIRSDTILKNMDKFNKDKLSVLPKDGVIMKTRRVQFYEGESVFDVLKRETMASKIHMEMEFYPIYNSAYIEGINNIYEFDCGELSGWMYKVNGWFPNYGSSRYKLKNGDVIEWVYTCDLGRDVGGYVEGVKNQ
ncbi:DUF4430 domain-containing protein [Ectobacillus sp. JY-23]|uniref:DUF4430 domain-containing protein n=1 Tax=Ectobacillus sp. JY-23 TaxID=2933872 RepID=UPI001FF6804F|nr:DUF4430 domain-containing protein [Ectobacillus sp. JY-23]UOY91710.1 DUF4430 domain-containing protein [Ectobacillus sp. JY-23]